MSQLEAVPLFTQEVWRLEVDNIEQHLQYFLPYIETLDEHKKVRTDFFDNSRYELPSDLNEIIINACAEIVGRGGLYVRHYWLQDYKHENYHGLHTHGDSIMSGVYYLRYKGHGAPLIFQNPNTTQWATSQGPYERFVEPKQGSLILFNGWMPHRVDPLPDTMEERSVLAFNVVRDYNVQ